MSARSKWIIIAWLFFGFLLGLTGWVLGSPLGLVGMALNAVTAVWVSTLRTHR